MQKAINSISNFDFIYLLSITIQLGLVCHIVLTLIHYQYGRLNKALERRNRLLSSHIKLINDQQRAVSDATSSLKDYRSLYEADDHDNESGDLRVQDYRTYPFDL